MTDSKNVQNVWGGLSGEKFRGSSSLASPDTEKAVLVPVLSLT